MVEKFQEPWKPVHLAQTVAICVCTALLMLTIVRDEDGFIFLLDHANLVFHEAGHPIYGLLGATMALYGGTLGQLTFPVVVAVSGWWRRLAVMTCVAVIWFGQNLINIARYMADARDQLLPLVGGGDHDWTNILARWNRLHLDGVFSGRLRVAGFVIMVLGAAWLVWRHHHSEEPERVDSVEHP